MFWLKLEDPVTAGHFRPKIMSGLSAETKRLSENENSSENLLGGAIIVAGLILMRLDTENGRDYANLCDESRFFRVGFVA